MLELSNNNELMPIPDKKYFTIGEVGELCDVKQHVLRYWEQEFEHLSPMKRRGNRRYYKQKDILIVRQIKALLQDEGYTISGARHQLNNGSKDSDYASQKISELEQIIRELQEVIDDLSK